MTPRLNSIFALTLLAGGCVGQITSSDQQGSGSDYSGPPAPDGGTSSDGSTGTGSDGGGGTGSGSETGSGSGSSGSTSGTPQYPTAHPRIYLSANRSRLSAALSANTASAKTFKSVVDEWVGGANQWGFEVWNAAMMGQLTGQPQYCAAAVAAIELQVTTAETAIAAGQAPIVAGDSYLYVGDYIGDLALTYDWCNDSLTADQKTRWLAYADQAVYNVWNHTTAAWGGTAMAWDGWATGDPSDNYYYSFMRATMLLGLATKGEDAAADGEIAAFRQAHFADQLIPTFDSQLLGGGSREGTSYGVAMRRLWELYDIWHATTTETIATATPQTRASMLAFMHQTLPTLDRVAPTGDQARDSTASFFDYDRQYLEELISLFSTDSLAPRAAYMLANSSIPAMTEQFMAGYDFLYDPQVTAQPMTGMNTAYYAPGIGELYARSGWDDSATWVNTIAGPYTESHAHQDQGSLMIYKDGWLVYDAVVDSKSGLRQETTAHSMVRIADSSGNPVPQVSGTTSKVLALHQGSGWLYSASDVTAAFAGNSNVSEDQREVLYLAPNAVIVYDRVASASGTSQVWQLASPVAPSISGATATFTNAGHTLAVTRLAPTPASSSVFDYVNDSSGDYTGGYRLDETASGGSQRYLHVLSIDGAATSAVASGDSSVTVTLSDGRTAVVTFNHDAIGASMVLDGQTISLGAGVDTLAQ